MLDPQGIPARDVRVSSIEMSDLTDADGHFAVRIKSPNQHVDLVYGGARYHRTWSVDDNGTQVEIRLPALHDAELMSDLETTCVYEATWLVGPGLVATATGTVEPGLSMGWREVPAGIPTVDCRRGPDDPAPRLVVDGRRYRLLPPAGVVRVQVLGEDGATPEGCGVAVGASLARPAGDGFWAAEGAGTTTVTATCAGRPAVPKTIRVGTGITVTLEWTAAGPSLDLISWLPSAEHVDLVSLGEAEPGWSLRVPRGADGRFHLPPLQRGRYAVYAGDALPLPADFTDAPPGRLWIDLHRTTAEAPVTGITGAIVVDRDQLDGPVRVELAPAG